MDEEEDMEMDGGRETGNQSGEVKRKRGVTSSIFSCSFTAYSLMCGRAV